MLIEGYVGDGVEWPDPSPGRLGHQGRPAGVDRPGCQGRLEPPARLPQLGAARAARGGGAPAGPPTGWSTFQPAAIPFTGCWTGSRPRSSREFDEWGETDRSHRKLAHRGSYVGRVWVSPSSVRRVLAAGGLVLRRPRRAGTSQRRPFPDWVTYTKNSIWIYDTTHFRGCDGIGATAVMDLVTRKWLATIVSVEETSTQVQVVFTDALEAEGLGG